jgi:molybdopterin molybdotransferase
MQGYTELLRPITHARITHEARKHQGRRYFLRGIAVRGSDGAYECSVQGNQSSALLKSVHDGNCLIVLPEGLSPVKAGTIVECIRLDMDEGVC